MMGERYIGFKPFKTIPLGRCHLAGRRMAIASLPVLVLLSASGTLSLAQPLHKTVAMVGARSGASWPLWIAKEAGL